MLLLVTESLPSCSSGGLLEDVFAVRLIHITAVLDSLLLLLSRGQLLLLLFGSMPSSPVGRIRFMLQVALGGNNDAGRQSAAGSRQQAQASLCCTWKPRLSIFIETSINYAGIPCRSDAFAKLCRRSVGRRPPRSSLHSFEPSDSFHSSIPANKSSPCCPA